MRSSVIKVSTMVGFALVVLALVFLFGLLMGRRMAAATLSVQMNGTQAMLAFNRISSERRLHYLLSNGCADIALVQVKVYEDQDKQLLAEFLQGALPDWTIRYISQGDPNLINELRGIKRTNTWTVPDCRKPKPSSKNEKKGTEKGDGGN